MRVAAAVLSLGIVLSAALPAYADYGAIAFDADSGKRGWSIHEATPQRAEQVALKACGADSCKVVVHIGPKRCGAVAGIEGKTTIGAAARQVRDAAINVALTDCRKRASADCVVQFSDCNH
jgi:hypothetical protein